MSCSKAFKSLVVVALSFFFIFPALAAEPVPAKVVSVSDGDTLKAVIGGEQVTIRCYGIDAPEKAQPFGQVSTSAMQQLTTGHNITVQAIDRDRYGRTVAMVYADGASVNEALIKGGNAWVYDQYCKLPVCGEWSRIQAAAKTTRSGIWQDANPTPPWEWRHGGQTAQSDSVQKSKPEVAGNYSRNVQSRKFHSATCRHAGCENCTAHFSSREQEIAAGYAPCKVCNP